MPRRRIASAWFSSAPETEDGGPSATASQQPAGPRATEPQKESALENPLRSELEAKTREVIDLKDKYLRSVADFRNLQERTRREVESTRQFAIQRFAKDLIESVDNLDRALTTVSPEKLVPSDGEPHDTTKDLVNLHDGLKMTEAILMQTLKKHGLERFDPSETQDHFDPNLHEATFQAPVPDKEDGAVFLTQQKGFILNGRVLRAAKVGIVKNPPASTTSTVPPPAADGPSDAPFPPSPS